MMDKGASQPHRGLTMGALACAGPIFAFLFGERGAEQIQSSCRLYFADPQDAEATLQELDEVESIIPGIEVDAAGFIDWILPDQPPSHAVWSAFFYGYGLSAHHAPVEEIIKAATGAEGLADAFDDWCPAELGADLSAAIDRAERRVAKGKLDKVDRQIIDDLLAGNWVYDVTYPIYHPIIDLIRMSHIRGVFNQLPPGDLAQVQQHLREAAA